MLNNGFHAVHESRFKSSSQLDLLTTLLKKGCPSALALEILEETNSGNYVVTTSHDAEVRESNAIKVLQKALKIEGDLRAYIEAMHKRTAMIDDSVRCAIAQWEKRAKLGSRKRQNRLLRMHLINIQGLLRDELLRKPPALSMNLNTCESAAPKSHS